MQAFVITPKLTLARPRICLYETRNDLKEPPTSIETIFYLLYDVECIFNTMKNKVIGDNDDEMCMICT